MSAEATNTPNGASKDLYSNNPDKGKMETNFLALEEKDPQKEENESDEAGSNSTVVPVEVGTIDTDLIQKVGYVGITVINVPTKEEYEAKKSQIMEEAAENSKEIIDKNRDGIDDRNQ